MTIDNQVLQDAINQLEQAQRQMRKLVKVTACTPEYERKLLVEVRANIHAALARIESGE